MNCKQVPWKTFASGRASLQISGVTLVLEPLGSANYDDEVERALRDAVFAKKQVFEQGLPSFLSFLPCAAGDHRHVRSCTAEFVEC